MTINIVNDYLGSRITKILIIIIIILILLVSMVLIIQVFLSRKVLLKKDSLSPLESGFESLKSSIFIRTPFFFLAVLFVLFDLELILFFPGVVFSWGNYFSLLL